MKRLVSGSFRTRHHADTNRFMQENLLTLNDMINNAMAKFADVQKGIYDTQYEISGKPPKQTDANEEPRQAISLIDLDDEPKPDISTAQTATPASSGQAKTNVLDELSDLFGQSATISTPPTQQQQQQQDLVADPLAFLSSRAAPTSSTPSSPYTSNAKALSPPAAVSPSLSSSSMTGGISVTDSLAQEHSSSSRNGGVSAIKHEPSKCDPLLTSIDEHFLMFVKK